MQLIQWDNIRKQIEEAKDINELNSLRDQMEALRLAAKQLKQSLEVQNKIADYRLRVDRRRGEWIGKNIKQGGDRKSNSSDRSLIPILKNIDVSYNESIKLQAIASLPEKLFEKHIEEVKRSNEELTTVGIIKIARELKRQQKPINTPDIPTGQFEIIYCDPPWRYEFSKTNTREIENHYATMELEDIKALKIPAAKDCILLLWATAPKLEGAMEVINAWGFKYRTCAIWDKGKIGMGYWFRGQHELLLLAVKGNPIIPLPENRFSSVIKSPRTKHSEKPIIVCEMIEKMFPNKKYLEMFARNNRKGWVTWGNEI